MPGDNTAYCINARPGEATETTRHRLLSHAGMHHREIDITLDNCVYGNQKFLYLSPERLQTDLFRERVKKMNVCMVAIDEAHCISQWGYDFRPPYLKIADLREVKPGVAFIALTASATKIVKEDIADKLKLEKPEFFQKSFARDNLSFVVRKTETKEKKLLEVLRKVPVSLSFMCDHESQPKQLPIF